MQEIGSGGINPFSKVELKDPAKKAEFDTKVQTALSDGILTKEEFSKLKEDFVAKDGPGLDKILSELPTDQEVTASLGAIPNNSDKALEPLRARYDKLLPDLAKMLGVEALQNPVNLKDSGLFVHVQEDKAAPLQPMEVIDPPLVQDNKKPTNLKDTGMYVHIEPDKAAPLQPMEVNDPSTGLGIPSTNKPVNLKDSGLFVHVQEDKAAPLPPMEVIDPSIGLGIPTANKQVNLKDTGLYVHVQEDPAAPLQPMEAIDPPLVQNINK